jgi:alpha-glucosidase
MDAPARPSEDWWRHAVVYQVYPRSFADADGDGIGDIAGIRSRLRYIADLGVDAIWINPWYASPMADGGYDVADFRAIHPWFGTLADAEALIDDAHRVGLRVILDIVPNHTSSAHAWFQAALSEGHGSAARSRYIFRAGRNGGGDPPNDWQSVFGGPAWTRVTDPDGRPGEWYLHLFAPEQPDLDWSEPEVRREYESILRFWFDRGADGFRIDVAHALVKHPELPDLGDRPHDLDPSEHEHPFWDRSTVHEVFAAWRAIADSYAEPRMFVAEAWVHSPQRLARYVRPGHLHSAFDFEFLTTPWRADALRRSIDRSLAAMQEVDALPTWVLSNHDVVRHLTRFAYLRQDTPAKSVRDLPVGVAPDLEFGTRRARAAILLMLALPGGAYLYQGEELGLWEVLDLPADVLDDPAWERSGHTDRGRDGCRVPLPWGGTEPSFGFGPPDGAPPWLPQPTAWASLTATAQDGKEGSMLELYRAALRSRRAQTVRSTSAIEWLPTPDGALAFRRGPEASCIVNLSAGPVPVPEGERVVLASAPLDADGRVPPDTAVWLERGGPTTDPG